MLNSSKKPFRKKAPSVTEESPASGTLTALPMILELKQKALPEEGPLFIYAE